MASTRWDSIRRHRTSFDSSDGINREEKDDLEEIMVLVLRSVVLEDDPQVNMYCSEEVERLSSIAVRCPPSLTKHHGASCSCFIHTPTCNS
jgi:hypothetical protein